MKNLRFLMLLVIFGVWPVSAHAQGGLWDYIEGGSGPGPFHGYTGEVRVLCVREDGTRHPVGACLSDLDENIKAVLNFRAGWYTSGDNPRFANAPTDLRTINMTKIESTFMYRITPVLDMGVGGGFLVLSGSGFESQTHPVVTALSVTLTPLGFLRGSPTARKWGRFLRFNFSDRVVFGQVNAADFNSTAIYSKGAEFQRDFSWGVDVGSLIWH
jgi:hypothetical protein